MRCAEFKQRWQAALDERSRPESDPRLAAHLRRCDHCREETAAFEAILDGLDVRSTLEPAEGFADRVVKKILAEQPAREAAVPARVEAQTVAAPVHRSRARAAALAVAASLLVTIGWQLLERRPEPVVNSFDGAVQQQVVGSEFAAKAPIGSEKPVAALNGPPGRLLGSGSDPLAQIDPGIAVPPGASLAELTDPEYLAAIRQTGWAMATFPETVRRVTAAESVHSVTETFRPVADSMSAVLDAFRRTLPGKMGDAKSSYLVSRSDEPVV